MAELLGCREVPPPAWTTSAYAVNATDHPMILRVRFPQADIDCDKLGDVARALGPAVFGEGITFELQAGETIPIEYGPAVTAAGLDGDAGAPPPIGSYDCDLVLLQTDGLPDTIARWDGLAQVSVPTQVDDDFDGAELGSGLVDLAPVVRGAAAGSPLMAVAPGDVRLARVVVTPEPSACASQAQSFQWSTPSSGVTGELISLTALPDGCLDLEIGTTGDTSHSFLCIPATAFPFQAGDSVSVSWVVDAGEGSETLRVSALYATTDDRQLSVFREHVRVPQSAFETRLVPLDCEGDRTACGAYVIPAALEISMPSGTVRLEPGDEAEIPAFVEGRTARVFVGRAEALVVARQECEPGRRELGTRGDFLIVFGGGT